MRQVLAKKRPDTVPAPSVTAVATALWKSSEKSVQVAMMAMTQTAAVLMGKKLEASKPTQGEIPLCATR